MQYCAHAWIVQCLHYAFIKLAVLNFHVELKGQVHRPRSKLKYSKVKKLLLHKKPRLEENCHLR